MSKSENLSWVPQNKKNRSRDEKLKYFKRIHTSLERRNFLKTKEMTIQKFAVKIYLTAYSVTWNLSEIKFLMFLSIKTLTHNKSSIKLPNFMVLHKCFSIIKLKPNYLIHNCSIMAENLNWRLINKPCIWSLHSLDFINRFLKKKIIFYMKRYHEVNL